MCIVIDINTYPSVFDPASANHEDFEPVLKWITTGKGKIVYGGTKYKEELARSRKYLKLFGQYTRAGKTCAIPDEDVDAVASELCKWITHRDFNDAHIMATIIVSRCKVVCSLDKSSDQFLTNPTHYSSRKAPRIYRSKNHKHLLCQANIVKICQ